MFQELHQFFNTLLGLNLSSDYLTTFHLITRITLVYIFGIFLVRSQRQFMGIHTTFNYILNFLLGSILASAVAGNVPFLPVLGMTLFIFGLNFLIAFLAYYSKSFESLIKGEPVLLVKNGKIMRKNMRRHLITDDELMDAIRKYTQQDKVDNVQEAFLESDGEITILNKEK